MWRRAVSLDKNAHKYISPKLCFTPETNPKYFGTGECVGIGQTTVYLALIEGGGSDQFTAIVKFGLPWPSNILNLASPPPPPPQYSKPSYAYDLFGVDEQLHGMRSHIGNKCIVLSWKLVDTNLEVGIVWVPRREPKK